MSYVVVLSIKAVPANDKKAWKYIHEVMEEDEHASGELDPRLLKLHDSLVDKYPCLSSYDDDDDSVDESPWSDGPLIYNFGNLYSALGLTYDRAEEVVPFIVECAQDLGVTVFDDQTGKIYRPNYEKQKGKKWWKIWG